MERKCSVCNETKDIAKFEKVTNRKSTWRNQCTSCRRRAYRLNKVYKMPLAYYKELLSKSNNMCMICEVKQTRRDLCIDHCHTTGKVRGLLCDRCNSGLGQFKDSIELLNKAAAYLLLNN